MNAPSKCPECGADKDSDQNVGWECGNSPDAVIAAQDCLQRQNDQLTAQIATLRDLVRSAYEEGADDGAMDRDNFLRSNAKSALDDLE